MWDCGWAGCWELQNTAPLVAWQKGLAEMEEQRNGAEWCSFWKLCSLR